MTKSRISHSTFLQLNYLLKHRVAFPLLLPVFFVLHGFVANYGAVYGMDAFLLAVLYLIITLFIMGISWLFFRNFYKAGLFTFFIMTYQFFFGVLQDSLTNLSPHSIISQYRFILPVSCLFFVGMIIQLKKRKKTLFIVTSYLNILLLLLILIDTGGLFARMSHTKKLVPAFRENFSACDTCEKPDIYFILLDEYAGGTALNKVFNFDNAAFENELLRRGFYLAKQSSSNYNLTPFSMASTLNMNYLDAGMTIPKHLDLTYVYEAIRNSTVINFFTRNGYQFFNLSVFDFPGQPAHKYAAFLPYGTELITSQTFTSRFAKATRADILNGKLPFKALQKKILYEYFHFNDDIFKETREIAAKQTTEPKFVYAHFLIPHWPYYYDSKGNLVPVERLQGFNKITTPHDYIEYLQYGNGKMLSLVDDIFAASSKPVVIILLGDHGFRQRINEESHKYDFMNLNAVYLPGKNYSQFFDSISNVNFFRVLLNTSFNQHLPLLKDSTINLSSLKDSTINQFN